MTDPTPDYYFPFTRSRAFPLLNISYLIHATRIVFKHIKQDNGYIDRFGLGKEQAQYIRSPPRSRSGQLDQSTVDELERLLRAELDGVKFEASEVPHRFSAFPFANAHEKPVFNLLAQLYFEPHVRHQLTSSFETTMARYKIGVGEPRELFADIRDAPSIDLDHRVFEFVRAELLDNAIIW